MTPDHQYPEKRGGRWPHVLHRLAEQDLKTAEYETEHQLTPIPPVVLPKIKITKILTEEGAHYILEKPDSLKEER